MGPLRRLAATISDLTRKPRRIASLASWPMLRLWMHSHVQASRSWASQYVERVMRSVQAHVCSIRIMLGPSACLGEEVMKDCSAGA